MVSKSRLVAVLRAQVASGAFVDVQTFGNRAQVGEVVQTDDPYEAALANGARWRTRT